MEKDIIKRSIRTSVIVAVIFTPFLYLYTGSTFTYGFIAGAAWNIVNVFLLFHLVTNLMTPAESNKGLGVIAGVIKFPLLYGAGYAVIRYTDVSLYGILDRKSTRLNSSHGSISYAVFCLKKKK